MRALPPGVYGLDAIEPGDHFLTEYVTVSAQSVDAFASLTGDHFEIHTSNEGARRHGFSARIAHGLLVLSLIEGLKSQSQVQFHTYAALGWDWTFHAPVYVGDQIRGHIAVKSRRVAGPDKGLLTLTLTVENQNAQIVQAGEARLMAYRQSPKPNAV